MCAGSSKEIKDSLFTATKSQQIHQLEVGFDTKKKEDQISLLNQETRLEKVNLRQANLLKDFSFAGIFLALVIARSFSGKTGSSKRAAGRSSKKINSSSSW
jgi:hypothetical protein